VYDIGLTVDFDLLFDANGDFQEIESTTQHQQLLLLTEKGEWDGQPLVGIGTINWINDERGQSGDLISEIRRQFEKDGMNVGKLAFNQNDGKFNGIAEYA
jgi:hypothetical protein